MTADFQWDDEVHAAKVHDGARAVIGGMLAEKTIKYTKNNQVMAFLTIEDLVGTVEVIVFPRDYEKNAPLLTEDAKIFVVGRVSGEEEKASKLICEKIVPFDEARKELWIKFPDPAAYQEKAAELMPILRQSDGQDSVVIYVENPKAMKRLPPSDSVSVDDGLIEQLVSIFGKENVKLVEKGIENTGRML